MKKCTKCLIEKELLEFNKHRRHKDGFNTICKICSREMSKKYRNENKSKVVESNKLYYENNREKLLLSSKEHKIKNEDYYKNYHKSYREKRKKYFTQYHQEYNKKYREYLSNYNKLYQQIRKTEDDNFRFRTAIRSNIANTFKRLLNRGIEKSIKRYKSEKILGCSIEDFRLYIQSLFTENMSFDNYGDWELDHIIPISSAKTLEDIEKLCHYTNYQPLWWRDNLEKRDKIIES